MPGIDRRDFIQRSSAAVASLGLGCTLKRKPSTNDADIRTETSDNIEGPYYRAEPPDRDMLDLYADVGTPVQLEGRVLDAESLPLAGAVIDFWHADPDGRYDTQSNEMRYYGRVTADEKGSWRFQSLVPGLYLNGSQYRPAHIHVKIFIDGTEQLTTQLYFKGDPHIDDDPFVESDLIVDFIESGDALLGMFDFVLA